MADYWRKEKYASPNHVVWTIPPWWGIEILTAKHWSPSPALISTDAAFSLSECPVRQFKADRYSLIPTFSTGIYSNSAYMARINDKSPQWRWTTLLLRSSRSFHSSVTRLLRHTWRFSFPTHAVLAFQARSIGPRLICVVFSGTSLPSFQNTNIFLAWRALHTDPLIFFCAFPGLLSVPKIAQH